MEKVIEITDEYTTVGIFNQMRVGDLLKVPYDDSRYSGIKSEAARRNRDARLKKELKNKLDIKYRVSRVEHPGYISIIKLK
ncbi:hypothetical protein [Bacteroides ihuae]|uniref:hypothetical protein n=1 Tax=Bacteroides ihuae TaxID=1852362 RepID=UPI0008D919FE|nr:hypothetical protein [Bacteroides ihuae]